VTTSLASRHIDADTALAAAKHERGWPNQPRTVRGDASAGARRPSQGSLDKREQTTLISVGGLAVLHVSHRQQGDPGDQDECRDPQESGVDIDVSTGATGWCSELAHGVDPFVARFVELVVELVVELGGGPRVEVRIGLNATGWISRRPWR